MFTNCHWPSVMFSDNLGNGKLCNFALWVDLTPPPGMADGECTDRRCVSNILTINSHVGQPASVAKSQSSLEHCMGVVGAIVVGNLFYSLLSFKLLIFLINSRKENIEKTPAESSDASLKR